MPIFSLQLAAPVSAETHHLSLQFFVTKSVAESDQAGRICAICAVPVAFSTYLVADGAAEPLLIFGVLRESERLFAAARLLLLAAKLLLPGQSFAGAFAG